MNEYFIYRYNSFCTRKRNKYKKHIIRGSEILILNSNPLNILPLVQFIPWPSIKHSEDIVSHIFITCCKWLVFWKILFSKCPCTLFISFFRTVIKIRIKHTDFCILNTCSIIWLFQHIFLKKIIRIQKGQILSLCNGHSVISCRTSALIFLIYNLDATVLFFIFFGNFLFQHGHKPVLLLFHFLRTYALIECKSVYKFLIVTFDEVITILFHSISRATWRASCH